MVASHLLQQALLFLRHGGKALVKAPSQDNRELRPGWVGILVGPLKLNESGGTSS